MAGQALSGLTVVELGTDISAPYCAKLFADLGAKVIKVELPEGDTARQYGPFPGDIPDPEKSGLFLYLNSNKQGVTLYLETAQGQQAFRSLVATADILVENTTPGTLERLGLTYEALAALNPRLVMTSISPLGQDPALRHLKAYPINLMQLSGAGWRTGDPEREPLTVPGSQSSYWAGISAAGATLCAILARDTTGRGQSIDISELEVLNCFFGNIVHRWKYSGVDGGRTGHRVSAMNASMQCQDGYIHFIANSDEWWQRLVKVLGDPEWAQAEIFNDRTQRAEHGDEVEALISDWLMSHTKEELFTICQSNRFPCGPYYSIAELLDLGHLQDRGYFVEMDHPKAGKLKYPGAPYLMSGTPWRLQTPAPLLGQHNEAVLGTLPAAPQTQTPVQAAPSQPSGYLPLDGVRILDFGIVWAVPFLGQQLADMGAEVIRIESRARLDGRTPGPNGDQDVVSGGANIHLYARGKKSITLNLSKPEAIDLFKQLVKVSDVVVNNFTPHVLPNWGLDYDELRKIKPDIILASLSAAGHSGRLMNITTYAPVLGALAGLETLVGYYGERPLGSTLMFCDQLNGTFGIIPIVAALRHRNLTGEGQNIDMSQWDATMGQMGEFFMDYVMNGRSAGPQGNRHPHMAPHNVYPCQGEDNWVSIAVANDQEWEGLSRALGEPEWTKDPRFADQRLRWEYQEELDRFLADWTRSRTREEIAEVLQREGVAAWPSLRTSEVPSHPLNVRRETFIEVDHPLLPGELHYAFQWRMSDTPPQIRRHGPLLGEHNEEIFGKVLGLSEAELRRLEEAKAIF